MTEEQIRAIVRDEIDRSKVPCEVAADADGNVKYSLFGMPGFYEVMMQGINEHGKRCR